MSTLCGPCTRGEHDACEPVPVAVDSLGIAVERAGYTDCRCLHGDAVEEALAAAREAYRRGALASARVFARNALALLEAAERPSAKVISLSARARGLADQFGRDPGEVEAIIRQAEELLGERRTTADEFAAAHEIEPGGAA